MDAAILDTDILSEVLKRKDQQVLTTARNYLITTLPIRILRNVYVRSLPWTAGQRSHSTAGGVSTDGCK